ncbi:restriction endonuclease [Streptomyces sp. ISL-100]|uniref:restriction endonuclease n=1 Tax=Streptomyces sp. ISL-100 TaxID=2819173 RepID=UPI001BE5370B|nr:restriction endonuclease [Streptomyces sp. ISL-100]
MNPSQFEQHIAWLCRRDGCDRVTVTGGHGDTGADIGPEVATGTCGFGPARNLPASHPHARFHVKRHSPRQPPSSTPPGTASPGSYGSRVKTNEPRSR